MVDGSGAPQALLDLLPDEMQQAPPVLAAHPQTTSYRQNLLRLPT